MTKETKESMDNESKDRHTIELKNILEGQEVLDQEVQDQEGEGTFRLHFQVKKTQKYSTLILLWCVSLRLLSDPPPTR